MKRAKFENDIQSQLTAQQLKQDSLAATMQQCYQYHNQALTAQNKTLDSQKQFSAKQEQDIRNLRTQVNQSRQLIENEHQEMINCIKPDAECIQRLVADLDAAKQEITRLSMNMEETKQPPQDTSDGWKYGRFVVSEFAQRYWPHRNYSCKNSYQVNGMVGAYCCKQWY